MEEDRVENEGLISRGFNYIKNKIIGPKDRKISKQAQSQSQLDLQKIVELQDQDCRNFTLGGLLSCLETIAYKESPNFQKKYDGYNPKSVQEKKDIDKLIIQLRLQSKSFQNMYSEYTEMNDDNYWFPDNLSKDQIISDITSWKKKVKPQYKVYYDNIINLLNGNEEDIYYPNLPKKKYAKASCDPKMQIKLIPPNIAYINLRRKIVKMNFKEGKQFDNTLKLYKTKHIDPNFEKINERYKKQLEKHDENCICENCLINIDCYN